MPDPCIFTCQWCKKQFNSQNALNQHCKDKGHKWFECGKCIKKFRSLNALNQHAKSVHKSLDTTKTSLKESILNRSRNEYTFNEVVGFKCPTCGYEKGVYNQTSSPLYSKRSYLIINCSNCGRGFRDTDY